MAKRKFCKRLLSFLKLKKYRRIGLRGPAGTRRIFPRTFKYNGSKRQYFLDRDQSFFFDKDSAGTPVLPLRSPDLWHITKKKGGVLSYLFMVTCRFPRKYVYQYLGRETFRRYYTMPFRLSMSRFVSYLTFKGYYGPKCARALTRNALSGTGRREGGAAKNALTRIEQRLDSSMLRLLHFKSLFTTKTHIRSRAHKVKSPWSTFSPPQIQQFIGHGHVFVNGRVARFANMKLGTLDQVGVFIHPRRRNDIGRRAPGLGGFSKVFYMIYRNMHLSAVVRARPPRTTATGAPTTNAEKDVKLILDAIESDQSAHLLWPVFSLLRISPWSSAKPNILARRMTKGDKWDLRPQLQRLLRWKRLPGVNAAKTIPDQVIRISNQDPSLMYARSSRCYASIVYGTRRCEWVKQLQQRGSKGSFFDRIYHKTNFLESELEYFQLLIRHYS